jgi:hypothetical protein
MAKNPTKRAPGRPRTGAALPAAERMRRLRKRRKAAGLKPKIIWVSDDPVEDSVYSSHRLLDARSLAMHAVIARKIEQDPSLLSIAKRNIERWSARRPPGRHTGWLQEWSKLLEEPWPRVAALITDTHERATRLRQSSPFAGLLSQKERRIIYAAFRP